ncbi:MAG: hypothetical protein PHR77_14670 [Kiritimatiellae bacterium]|nr:hypothetical protein [Kiritimatiellia bacterium]MDD5521263.1 hypothetical protein [Kiritimatiellia bacterium]
MKRKYFGFDNDSIAFTVLSLEEGLMYKEIAAVGTIRKWKKAVSAWCKDRLSGRGVRCWVDYYFSDLCKERKAFSASAVKMLLNGIWKKYV